MATWSDALDHLRSTYRLQRDEPSSVAMTWAWDDGRTQQIIVRRFQINDVEDMVEFKSPFAKLGGPDPIELLRENARLPFGAVALSGEHFLVVHNAKLATISLTEFDALLHQVAALADRMESKHLDNADAY